MLKPQRKTNAIPKALAYGDCPAKTYTRPDGKVEQGRSVLNHCQIVGEVAKALLKRIPLQISKELFPTGSALTAAAHDIGKVSPYFVEKIRQACSPELTTINQLVNINPNLESQWGGHAGVSQVTAKEIHTPNFVAEILGRHHGFSPSVATLRANDEIFGGNEWQIQRESLVDELKKNLKEDWPEIKDFAQALAISGLTTVSDWIGSSHWFENPNSEWKKNIEISLDAAGFIAPKYKQFLTFEKVFGFDARETQQQFINKVTKPGVYILEAPMGVGKTEAALYAAYQVLASNQASGIYFALPTQLTSNKIFERFNEFLNQILESECTHKSLLLHSKSWLTQTEMGEEGRPGGAWFNQNKRGLLAPFSVGTIDQSLMAAMNVKHGFVRAFGLAGKVVILDEVHTYDAYTGTILDSLVDLLRKLHCTVIVLSATLNQERREKLIGIRLTKNGYPLITSAPKDEEPEQIEIDININREVVVHLCQDIKSAISEVLERATQGQQVLWIENTVGQAQERYFDIAAQAHDLGIECGLLHSRFTQTDREYQENKWVNDFGKSGQENRSKRGRILIGTQVLEQSLDIDADFLITAFAPSDMILQRLGRLWRHAETKRPDSAKCETWLIAPQLELATKNPTSAFGNSAYVYSPYVLCRSLQVWNDISILQLPRDIRKIIEDTYKKQDESEDMAWWLHELENGTRHRLGRTALRQLANITLAANGKTLPENKVLTRHSETESTEVLLLRELSQDTIGRKTTLKFLNGEKITMPWDRYKLNHHEWRTISSQIMKQVVVVPIHQAPNKLPIKILENLGFQNCFYLGNSNMDESMLRIAIVEMNNQLSGLFGYHTHDSLAFTYRNDFGYRVKKLVKQADY